MQKSIWTSLAEHMPAWLDAASLDFPPTEDALAAGLLAFGGDLSPARLLAAYTRGIFPWYSEGEPIAWWTPAPRAVIFPGELRMSRSLKRLLGKTSFQITEDAAFAEVIRGCAGQRPNQEGTWITRELLAAFTELHHLGFAHSVECWQDGEVAGGIYGLALGRVFFGESMFSAVPGASRVALVHLCQRLDALGYKLLDCQMMAPHLARLGARALPREVFETLLQQHVAAEPGNWQANTRAESQVVTSV